MDPNAAIGTLTAVVAILALLQGWQMLAARKSKKNNSNGNLGNPGLHVQNGVLQRLDTIILKGGNVGEKLDKACEALGRMEQRLNDIWNEVKRE